MDTRERTKTRKKTQIYSNGIVVRNEGIRLISRPWYTCMDKKIENSMYDWSKDNTKHVRIHTEVWKILKEQAKEEEKSMMQVLNKLIMESYGE